MRGKPELVKEEVVRKLSHVDVSSLIKIKLG
jgi:hypothetical protein